MLIVAVVAYGAISLRARSGPAGADTASPEPSPEPSAPAMTAPPELEGRFMLAGGTLYADASYEAPVIDAIEAEVRYVVGDPVEAEGSLWYRAQTTRPFGTEVMFGWLSGNGRVATEYVHEPPACPTGEPAAWEYDGIAFRDGPIDFLTRIHPQVFVDCVGDQPITLQGRTSTAQLLPDEPIYAGTPSWLAVTSTLRLGWVIHPGRPPAGGVALHVDPSAGVDIPLDEWLEITGHFADPAADGCRREPTVAGFSAEAPAESVIVCRQRFVVSAARAVPPPDEPDPRATPDPSALPPSGSNYLPGLHVDEAVEVLEQAGLRCWASYRVDYGHGWTGQFAIPCGGRSADGSADLSGSVYYFTADHVYEVEFGMLPSDIARGEVADTDAVVDLLRAVAKLPYADAEPVAAADWAENAYARDDCGDQAACQANFGSARFYMAGGVRGADILRITGTAIAP